MDVLILMQVFNVCSVSIAFHYQLYSNIFFLTTSFTLTLCALFLEGTSCPWVLPVSSCYWAHAYDRSGLVSPLVLGALSRAHMASIV